MLFYDLLWGPCKHFVGVLAKARITDFPSRTASVASVASGPPCRQGTQLGILRPEEKSWALATLASIHCASWLTLSSESQAPLSPRKHLSQNFAACLLLSQQVLRNWFPLPKAGHQLPRWIFHYPTNFSAELDHEKQIRVTPKCSSCCPLVGSSPFQDLSRGSWLWKRQNISPSRNCSWQGRRLCGLFLLRCCRLDRSQLFTFAQNRPKFDISGALGPIQNTLHYTKSFCNGIGGWDQV